MNKSELFWTPLDNAAKIYPAIRSKENTTVVRLTAVLKERVMIKHLFKAIALAEKRFPYFKVTLRKGFFWFYLEQIDLPVIPHVDKGIPCRAFNKNNDNRLLFRILIYKNQISAEFSHILTDGYGASRFLNSILIYYFRAKGVIRNNEIDSFYTINPKKEEYEDAYNTYFKENIPTVIRQPKAFHLPFSLSTKPRFDVLVAIISIADLKNKSDKKGVGITDYLIAVYLWVLQEIINDLKSQNISSKNKIIRIQVPVNLRNFYPSKTMRNFSLFVLPEIDLRLGNYSFDEIIKIVYHKMQLETDEKLINKIISRNVGIESTIQREQTNTAVYLQTWEK